jgi:hypothetical protein
MSLDNFRNWSDVLKNLFQVAAVLVAGWWTYHLFVKKEAPGLEARGSASSKIEWQSISGSSDKEVDFQLLLQNTGTTSFNVSKIWVRGWEFDMSSRPERIRFLDVDQIKTQPPFFDKAYELNQGASIPFPSHYPPGASNYNSFTWVLKPDCTKRLYLVAEVYKAGKESPNWSAASWAQECPQ